MLSVITTVYSTQPSQNREAEAMGDEQSNLNHTQEVCRTGKKWLIATIYVILVCFFVATEETDKQISR